MVPHIAVTSMTTIEVPQKSLAAPMKVFVDSENTHKIVGVDTMQEEHGAEFYIN